MSFRPPHKKCRVSKATEQMTQNQLFPHHQSLLYLYSGPKLTNQNTRENNSIWRVQQNPSTKHRNPKLWTLGHRAVAAANAPTQRPRRSNMLLRQMQLYRWIICTFSSSNTKRHKLHPKTKAFLSLCLTSPLHQHEMPFVWHPCHHRIQHSAGFFFTHPHNKTKDACWLN